METLLQNTAKTNGMYDEVPTEVQSAALTIRMVAGLTVVKSADKEIWTEGELTFSVHITNDTDKTYSDIQFSDVLDSGLILLVDNSVRVNGLTADYNYSDITGLLTIDLADMLPSQNPVEITFRVQKR